MNFLYKTLYVFFAFSISFFSYAAQEPDKFSSFFENLFKADEQIVQLEGWDAYYPNLKKRVVDLKEQSQIITLFTNELKLNPDKANEIIKVFIGKHPEFGEMLISAFIDASKTLQLPTAHSLPKNISKEIIGKLKPIKTLVIFDIRELFNNELSKLIDKYPQYPAQLLAYASELNIVEKQSIVKLNNADITKHQVDFIKTEEAPEYDIAIAGVAILAAAAGGGGGGDSSPTTCGGGPCVPTSDKDSYETAEYTSQKGLGLVNASTLYSYGGTGEGIKVAVFDSGVYAAHTEFGTRVLSSDGYDYIGTGITTDENGHGTHVSGTIAAGRDGGGSGMQGVAYKAKIIPYKIGNAAGAILTTDAQNKDSYTRAISKGARIFNNSWGSSVKITDASKAAIEAAIPLALAEMQVAIDAGAVFVWASGNNYNTEVSYRSGLPHHFPDMKKGYLAVTSVSTADGSSSSFANDCGVAAAWCISAPGGSVYSTWKDGAYKTISGTSMAAPHVSGALAGLKSRFPSLSYHQVRDRLLATADSTGIYADTATFGVGLMDLAAASSPVGVTMITLTTDDSGSVISSSSTAVTLSSDVFSIFANRIENNKIMLVDSFDRAAFYTDASAFIKSKKKSFNVDLELLFDQQNTVNKQGVSYYKSTNGQIGLSGVVGLNNDSPTMYWFAGDNSEKALNKILGLSDSISVAKNTSTGLSLQIMPEGKLGVWTNISSKTSDDGLIPLAIQNSITIASLNTGLSLTKDFSINNSLITAGIAYGKPDALSNSLSASGAFKVEAKDAIVSFASIGSTLGRFNLNLTAQNTQINSANDLSLFKVPDNISLNDVNAKISFESLDKNSQISLSMGTTQAQGNSTSTLSIPVSIDESGSVSYLDMSTPTGALFNHTRLSLSAKTRVNDDLDLVGVISSYNPTANKVAGEQVVGVASRWKF